MRVAVVHSYYSSAQPSGENVVVDLQAEALRRAGHEVRVIAARTDEKSQEFAYPIRSAVRASTGLGASPSRQLREFEPNVVHVHNLFPNFGSRWLEQWDGPVVATIHNFRPICAAGSLFRDGQRCTLCPAAGSHHAVLHSCYRNSVAATIPLAVASRSAGAHQVPLRRPDRLVMLSDRAKREFLALAPQVKSERISIVPNFAPDRGSSDANRDGWVFVGRISAEKGLVELLNNWPEHENLDIYGTGPLEAQAKSVAPRSASFHGTVSPAEIHTALGHAEGLLFPSLWLEPAPAMSYVEAVAAGTPVVAWPGTAVADDVEVSGSGVVVTDSVEMALSDVRSGAPQFSVAARQRYERQFTERAWVAAMDTVYRSVV